MGFCYIHPQTGTEFIHVDLASLTRQVKNFFLANNFPLGIQWQLEFEDNLCSHLVDSNQHCADLESKGVPPRKISATDVANYLRTMASWAKAGMPFVSQEQAEKRASEGCVGCPNNMKTGGCSACSGIPSLISNVLQGRHTSQDPKLNNCGACLCNLKSAVHIPLEYKKKYMSEEMINRLPSRCWILKESQELAKSKSSSPE